MRAAILVAVALLCAIGCQAEGDCNGHGTLADGKCVCKSPLPTTESGPGWVGDECEIPVYSVLLEAQTDLTASSNISTLQPGSQACVYATADELFSLPTHMAVAHLLKSGSGPVDVFGLLVPMSDAQPPPPAPYPKSTTAYNFVATSTKARPEAGVQVDQDSAGTKASGVYLCVKNEGGDAAEVALRAALHTCPFQLAADGAERVCSSSGGDKRYEGEPKCPSGLCACSGAYARPSHVAVLPGLGFEDCSAPVTALGADGPSAQTAVEAQPAGTWHFFSFSVAPANHNVWVTATATKNTSSDLELYLRFWQPPGRASPQQHDAATAAMDFRHRSRQDLSATVEMGEAVRPGQWFAGVYVSGSDPITYDLSVHRAGCPHGCLPGRGECQANGTCACTSSDFMGADCSYMCTTLELGKAHREEPKAGWESDMFTLSGMQDLLAAGTISLHVEATFLASTNPPLPDFVTERPVLLLSGSGTVPSWDSAEHRLVLESGAKAEYLVPGNQVVNGTLYAVVYNPLSTPYAAGYELTVTPVAHCVADCSGHGTCDQASGRCLCQEGFAGTDCSVDTKQFTNATEPCKEASLRHAYDVNGGSAYSVCVCAPGGAGGPGACDFVSPNQHEDSAGGVVVCSEGFHLQGARESPFTLSDGRHLRTGGRCGRVSKPGVSGGMVFFYCLLSVVLAAGMAFSSKYVVAIWDVYVLPELQSRGFFRGRGEGYTSLFDGFGGRNDGTGGAQGDAW